MRRPPFHHNHGHPNTKSILQHSIKHALKNISSRDWTSSSVEGQYWGTSHATTSTFSALNNLPIPSRDWGPDAAGERRKPAAGSGRNLKTSLEGIDQVASHATTSTFSGHNNQPIGHTPIPIATNNRYCQHASPLNWRCQTELRYVAIPWAHV